MTDEEIEVLISRLLDEMHTGPDVIEIQTIVKALTLMVAVRNVI